MINRLRFGRLENKNQTSSCVSTDENRSCYSASQPLVTVPNRAPCSTSPFHEKSKTWFTFRTEFALKENYKSWKRQGKKKMQRILLSLLSWSEGPVGPLEQLC
jgi:hypothetical protein